jgi:simple sugar transport system ATP-binding protein
MTDSAQRAQVAPPILELRDVSKRFGNVVALDGVSIAVQSGEVLCLLGDNGAGKSTLIKVLSGVHRPDEGMMFMDGEVADFRSPRAAIESGIATVFQDLALFPSMSITRNFVAGSEPARRSWMLAPIDFRRAAATARASLAEMGIGIRDPSVLVGALSGGERQTLAIARAESLGARVLILDEPTSALGVKEAALVLRHIVGARLRGMAILLITHNVHHARAVGDRFVFMRAGRSSVNYDWQSVGVEEMTRLMGGGAELVELEDDLAKLRGIRGRG